jgi:small multidrug resistance pump
MSLSINTTLALALAIITEVAGTTALQLSQQLTKPLPIVVMAICYLASLYCLSLALKTIPIGVAYAAWSGLGIVLISAVGYVKFGQALDAPAIVGVSLIVIGVVVANVFSKSLVH